MSDNILSVEGLTTVFKTFSGDIQAVDDVSFTLKRNEVMGIVGESGCGKSITARSIMKLVEFENGRIANGTVNYTNKDGQVTNLMDLHYKSAELRAIRGAEIAMIFQEPMTSFNPVYTIGNQMSEMLRYHLHLSKAEARDRAIDMLDRVKIPNPSQRFDEHPHEFSGGMRQRAMIAMALSCNPKLLIADEPTTALDVTVEAQILDLLNQVKVEEQMTTIIITHDMAVISEMTDHVMVMYAGRVAEYGSCTQVLDAPLHPYTQALLKSIPRIGSKEELYSIEGAVPSLLELPTGCYFAPRCPSAMPHCHEMAPPTFTPETGHNVRCWLYGEPDDGTEVRPAPDRARPQVGSKNTP